MAGRGGSEAVTHTLRDSLGRKASSREKSAPSNRCSSWGGLTTLLSSDSSAPLTPGRGVEIEREGCCSIIHVHLLHPLQRDERVRL